MAKLVPTGSSAHSPFKRVVGDQQCGTHLAMVCGMVLTCLRLHRESPKLLCAYIYIYDSICCIVHKPYVLCIQYLNCASRLYVCSVASLGKSSVYMSCVYILQLYGMPGALHMAAAVPPKCKSESEKKRISDSESNPKRTYCLALAAPAGQIANPNPQDQDFQVGFKIRKRKYCFALVGAGLPIRIRNNGISDSDSNPKRWTPSGHDSWRAHYPFRLGFESEEEI